jgi:hypothetical protein
MRADGPGSAATLCTRDSREKSSVAQRPHVLAFALWGVAAARWWLVVGAPEVSTERDLRSVAVSPFAVRGTGQPNEAAFVDGIHDDILTQLAKIAYLKVISRTSVMPYRDPQQNLPGLALQDSEEVIAKAALARPTSRSRPSRSLRGPETSAPSSPYVT